LILLFLPIPLENELDRRPSIRHLLAEMSMVLQGEPIALSANVHKIADATFPAASRRRASCCVSF